MQNLTKEYLLLFNAITDAETLLARLRADLIAAQQQAEALFLTFEGGRRDQIPPAPCCIYPGLFPRSVVW